MHVCAHTHIHALSHARAVEVGPAQSWPVDGLPVEAESCPSLAVGGGRQCFESQVESSAQVVLHGHLERKLKREHFNNTSSHKWN